MIKNKGNFIIKFEKEDEGFVDNLSWDKLNQGYADAKKFFEYEGEILPIRICLVYSPEEYLFFSGYPKYENWMRACTGNHNTIYIFAPSVVEKYTIHKKESSLGVLIHEIAHFFYGYSSMRKNLTRFPLWDEGIANYIANKKIDCKLDLDIPTLKNFKDNPSMNYSVGYLLIKCIMEHFNEDGNRKIIEFLTKIEQSDSEDILFKKFKEIFGIDVNTLIDLKGGKK